MWAFVVALLVVVGAVAVAAVIRRREREGAGTDLVGQLRPGELGRARRLGERDGGADMPSSVTAEPYPTIQMLGLYEAGEETCAAVEAAHKEETGDARVRLTLLADRAQSQTSAAKQRHAGAKEALRQADDLLGTRLAQVDSQTHQLVLEYWAANLAARLPADRLNLANLSVPTPAEMRALGTSAGGATAVGAPLSVPPGGSRNGTAATPPVSFEGPQDATRA